MLSFVMEKITVGDGECTGDAVWASIRCGANQNVGCVHAEIMDHSADYLSILGSNLCLVPSYS